MALNTLISYLKYVAKKQPSFIVYLSLVQQQLKQQPHILVANKDYTMFERKPLPPILCIDYYHKTNVAGIYAATIDKNDRKVWINEEKKLFVHSDQDYTTNAMKELVTDMLKQRVCVNSYRIMAWFTPQQLLNCDLTPIQPSITTKYLEWYDEWQSLCVKSTWDTVFEMSLVRKEQGRGNNVDNNIEVWMNQVWMAFGCNIEKLIEIGYEIEDAVIVRDVFDTYWAYTMKCIAQDTMERYSKIGRYESGFVKTW